ncbi:MAG TPA: 4-hydroxy-tetrahydrodipicolinate reductase [Kofleriaceae bacterium]
MRLCLAGATGWAGSELARGIAAASDLTLVGAVARSAVGKMLSDVVAGAPAVTVSATVAEAVAGCDVLVEYTRADAAKGHVLAALAAGAHVVVGSSGLSDADYAEIDSAARDHGRGVLACGNFALTMVLLQKFAAIAARYVPSWEVIDYAYGGKPDAPSGTARELAARLGSVRAPEHAVAVADTLGEKTARGATLGGTQVHSVRLPGFVIGVEAIFGMPDQTLSLRHNAGSSAKPYVDGALLAIRKVGGLVGLHRGLDSVLDI